MQTVANNRRLGSTVGQQPSQVRAHKGFVLINMGPSGAGKTSLIETLYDTEEHAQLYAPVAVLDIDNKAHVLRDSPHLDILPANTWALAYQHYEALQSAKYDAPFKTIVWDGLAILQSKSHTHQGVDQLENAMDRQKAYGKSNTEMTKIAEQAQVLAGLGFNVIFNIWSKPKTMNEDTGMEIIQPDITAKLLRDFIGIMDFVVYTECAPKIMNKGKVVQGPYPPIMRTGGSSSYGTRTAVSPDSPLRDMPDLVYYPSLADILDSFHGAPWKQAAHERNPLIMDEAK